MAPISVLCQWDLKAEYVFNRPRDSLANWQQLLTEIKKVRSTFDTSDMRKSLGVCVIEQVQARVNAKGSSSNHTQAPAAFWFMGSVWVFILVVFP